MRPMTLAAIAALWMISTHTATAVEAAAATSGPLPAEIFARHPSYEVVRLSPDGRHVAVAARVGTGQTLVVLTVPERKLTSSLRFDEGAAISDLVWVSDQRLVIAMGYQDAAEDAPEPTGELIGMNADGTGKGYLFGFRGERLSGTRLNTGAMSEDGFAELEGALPENPGHALVSVTTSRRRTANGYYYVADFTPLFRMDVSSGRRVKLADPPMKRPLRWFTDGVGNPRLVHGLTDESYVGVHYWRAGDSAWQPLKVEGLDASPLRLSLDGRLAFFMVDRDQSNRCLVELSLPAEASGTPSRRDLVCRPARELDDVHFDHRGLPYGYSAGPDAPLVILDPGSVQARITVSLQQQFPDQVVRLAQSSRDAGSMLFFVHSDRNSGEYYLYDGATREAGFFDAIQTWVEPERMATVRRLQYTARDGQKIDALLTLPPGAQARNLPLVVMPHGGPIGVRDHWGWDAEPQFLASRGYAVLQMNFRGSSGYGLGFEQAGHGEWAGRIIDDITDGARWAIAQKIADPRRMCIAGSSYGGYAALMSAVREPDLYRCAVGYSGAYDLNLLMQQSDVTVRAAGQQFWADTIADTPDQRAAQSPVHGAAQIKAAVLIVHGERDLRTPMSQALALRKALEKAGKSPDWLIEPAEGHGFLNEAARARYFEKLDGFLRRYLGAS